MGTVSSSVFGHLKRFINKYNIEFRTQKFLEKGNLPRAPSYFTKKNLDIDKIIQENPSLKKEFEDLNKKNEQLDEYLKKVYLTSNKVKEVQSQKSLPVSREIPTVFFNEPEKPNIGCITLTKFTKLLVDFQNDPKKCTLSSLSSQYALDKDDAANLLMYYSLFKKEKYDFMRTESEPKEKETESETVEFDVYKEKPVKQIQEK